MKDLTELKEKIVSTESVKQLVQILGSETKDHIRLKGLKGAINSFLIAYGHSAHQKNFLIIAEEKESAAYLLNDLENINADNIGSRRNMSSNNDDNTDDSMSNYSFLRDTC